MVFTRFVLRAIVGVVGREHRKGFACEAPNVNFVGPGQSCLPAFQQAPSCPLDSIQYISVKVWLKLGENVSLYSSIK